MEEYRFTPRQRFWTMAGFVLGFVIVGGSAFAGSYTHIRDVALIYHQSEFVANLMPWSLDGMLGIATIAMYIDVRSGRHPRGWARFAFWFGLAASMGANIGSYVSVWGPDVGGILVAAAPPAFFMVSVEVVSKPGRLKKAVDAVERGVGAMRAAIHAVTAAHPQHDTHTQTTPPASQPDQANTGAPTATAAVRRGRPDNEEPPEQLLALARQVGRQYWQQTGRMITRDALRAAVKQAGWPQGFSHVVGGRLLEAIRNDTNDGEDQGVRQVQGLSEVQGVSDDLATANGRA